MDIITKFQREWKEFEPLINTTTQNISKTKLVSFDPESKTFELDNLNGSSISITTKEARSLNKYFNRMFADDQ